MVCYVQDKGELVMRAYTPTSCDDDVGYFDLVVKIYFADNNPNFPLVGFQPAFWLFLSPTFIIIVMLGAAGLQEFNGIS